MEGVRQMCKGSSINNERSPQKKIKLESDDRMKEEEDEHGTPEEFSNPVPWQKIEAEGLDCDYAQLFSKDEADSLFQKLEEELVYSTGTKSLFVLTGGETGIEWLCMFLSQGRRQQFRCLERCTTYPENRPRTEMQA